MKYHIVILNSHYIGTHFLTRSVAVNDAGLYNSTINLTKPNTTA